MKAHSGSWLRAIAAACVVLSAPALRAADDAAALLPFWNTIEADSEAVLSSDIQLTDTRLLYRHEGLALEWDAAFSYASFDIDYRPFTEFDFLGFSEHLHEDRFGGQANLRYSVVDRLTLLGGAGAYDGYPDYRRVWIANRFRQKYDHPDFPRIPGYEEPNPWGWNASAGLRWEYLPLRAFAELKATYASDQTAPGYEDSTNSVGDYLLLRGREKLDTTSLGLSSENVLNSWLRALNEFSIIDTTARELRFTYQGSLNAALSSKWVLRGYGGVSAEDPQFEAFFFGSTAEWELTPALSLSLTGRYYKDTGEIENSLFTSTAAPPLESWEVGLGFRYLWSRSSLRLYIGALWTNYDPIRSGTAEFTYLYADREWALAQLAYSWKF